MKLAIACAALLLSVGPALAETTYVVDKVTITGSKTVPVDTLLGAIQEQKGSRVTTADIVADQGRITDALKKANVVGGIKTSMKQKPNKHIEVMFDITDNGAQAPEVVKIAPKLHKQIFDGNKSIDSDTLAAATGLKPGDDLSNAKIQAAEAAIAQAYKDAKLQGIGINLSGDTATYGNGQADVTWHIVETKAKKKPRDVEDERSQLEQ